MVELPEVDRKCHKFLRCCSDAMELGTANDKGRFLFATKNIKPGTVLIVDKPFSFVTDFHAFSTNCLFCHVSLKCRYITSVPCQDCSKVQS